MNWEKFRSPAATKFKKPNFQSFVNLKNLEHTVQHQDSKVPVLNLKMNWELCHDLNFIFENKMGEFSQSWYQFELNIIYEIFHSIKVQEFINKFKKCFPYRKIGF